VNFNAFGCNFYAHRIRRFSLMCSLQRGGWLMDLGFWFASVVPLRRRS
jgi:hypothetical protein